MSNLTLEKIPELSEIIKLAAAEGAKAAVNEYRSEQKKNIEKINDSRLNNTKLLLENYRDFKKCAENAKYTVEQAEDSIDYLDLLWDPYNRSDYKVESIKSNTLKTNIIVAHIDGMISTLKELCENSHNHIEIRKFNILYDRYISNTELDIDEIADKYFVDKRTVYNDIKSMINRLAKLIFGIDYALNKQNDNIWYQVQSFGTKWKKYETNKSECSKSRCQILFNYKHKADTMTCKGFLNFRG